MYDYCTITKLENNMGILILNGGFFNEDKFAKRRTLWNGLKQRNTYTVRTRTYSNRALKMRK